MYFLVPDRKKLLERKSRDKNAGKGGKYTEADAAAAPAAADLD